MQVLENRCPKCKGNVIIVDDFLSLTCESCSYEEKLPTNLNKNRKAQLLEESKEYGPKELRLPLTPIGRIFVDAFKDSGILPDRGITLGEMLYDLSRGLELPEEAVSKLRQDGLVK